MSSVDQIDSVISRAKDYYYSGNHEEAIELLGLSMTLSETEAKEFSKSTEFPSGLHKIQYATLYFVVQSIFLHNVDAANTISLLETKLHSIVTTSSKSAYYDILDLLGLALYYKDMGKSQADFSVAKAKITQSLEYRKTQSSPKLALSYFHLGLIQQSTNQASAAFGSFHLANKLAHDQSNPLVQSFSARQLGLLYQHTGDLEKARTMFEQSLNLRLDAKFLVYVPFSCISLGEVYLALGQNDRAKQFFNKARDIANSIGSHHGAGLSYLSLYHYYQTASDQEQAIQALLDCYYHAKTIGHEGLMQSVLRELV